MTDDAKKPDTKAVITPFAGNSSSHKNQPIGPASGKLIPEWRKDRDYEQIMPTPNM